MPYSMATSFFEQSNTHHLASSLNDLWNEDFVLAASHVSHCQLSRLEVSPYQEALLVRGICHRHWGQVPDGWMEQVMGYAGAIGTMLMDEVASVCGRVEERFTSIQMDIGKLEMELLKAHDWSTRAQDQIDRLETLVHQLEGSQRLMRLEMDKMVNNMNGLLELNWQMILDILQLRMGQVYGQDNLIVIDTDSSEEDVLDTAPVPVPGPVEHRLVPIKELTESIVDSEEGSSGRDEVWEISCEEFVGSSPEL